MSTSVLPQQEQTTPKMTLLSKKTFYNLTACMQQYKALHKKLSEQK
jgi:hypothetical protein